jgi:hypothetical protein
MFDFDAHSKIYDTQIIDYFKLILKINKENIIYTLYTNLVIIG